MAAGLALVGLLLVAPVPAVGHDLYIDDHCGTGLSSSGLFFAGGPAETWEIITGSGWNDCHLRTLINKNDDVVNHADWYLNSDPDHAWKYNHVYTTWAYVDSDGSRYTTQAIYRVYANGSQGGVTDVHTLDQLNNQSEICYRLGTNDFSATNGGYVRAIDLSSDTATAYLYVDIFCYVTDEGH